MARYIDVDLLIKDIEDRRLVFKDTTTVAEALLSQGNVVRKAIEEAPTADVVEVKHGVWIEHFAGGCWHYDCPFCNDGYATREKDNTPPNYCQNCGAKMDGGKEE